jgi:hypothetical protein
MLTIYTSSQTIWIFAQNQNCSDEISYTVSIESLPVVDSIFGGNSYCVGDIIAPIQVAFEGSGNNTITYTID